MKILQSYSCLQGRMITNYENIEVKDLKNRVIYTIDCLITNFHEVFFCNMVKSDIVSDRTRVETLVPIYYSLFFLQQKNIQSYLASQGITYPEQKSYRERLSPDVLEQYQRVMDLHAEIATLQKEVFQIETERE